MYPSLMKAARNVKRKVSSLYAEPLRISAVRRVGRIAAKERICAMTFDDGPCLIPPSESPGSGPLTLELLRILQQYQAFGTFDIIGDTSGNYPDRPGRRGTVSWGGIRYDHYPDIKRDLEGGAVNTDEIIKCILKNSHALANHGYAHVLFGRKILVYGRRAFFPDITAVLNDLNRLHNYIKEKYNYEMTLSRPPHYVDVIPDGFSSYDAYAVMGYTYMAADFDGAGWLPLSSYKEEVDAMVTPVRKLLEEDPDALCGQIIFHKDGMNMAGRTPVADGLPLQLEVLRHYGYKVVTVPDLLAVSPFSDLYNDHPCFPSARTLLDNGMCAAFRDNTVRPESICTTGEFYMMMKGRQAVLDNVARLLPPGRGEHPYARAAGLARASGITKSRLDSPLDSECLDLYCKEHFGAGSGLSGGTLPRGEVINAIAQLLSK